MVKVNRKRRWIFPIALMVYALVFLVAMAFGLDFLWDYMEAYEQSRPHVALNAYVQKLTAEYVADASGELIAKIDHNVQTEESCRQAIVDALSGKFTCAKKSAESDENHHVYAIRCGAKVIGTMEMERCGEEKQGFTVWKVTKDSFDLSYLLTQPISITVPENYCVFLQEKQLESAYISEDKLQYSLLAEFYEDFTLPYMVTYTAGPFLGEAGFTVKDPDGNPVTIDENTDMNGLLARCTQEQTAALDEIIEDFLNGYMKLTSNTGSSPRTNYNRLTNYMVTGGNLENRMYSALSGLSWVRDRKAEMLSITTHNYVDIGNGRYMCDVTYEVEEMGVSERIKVTSDVKLIFLATEDGLRAEAMVSI